jgi:hypothetical protein
LNDTLDRLRARQQAKEGKHETPKAAKLAEMWMKLRPEKTPVQEMIGAAHMVMIEGLTRRYDSLDDQLKALVRLAEYAAFQLKLRQKLRTILADLERDGTQITKEELLTRMQALKGQAEAEAERVNASIQ